MPKTTKKADAAWKFISWATGKEYEKLVGEKLGWSRVPVRQAHLDLRDPGVQGVREGVRRHHARRRSRTPTRSNPGVQPRPALGVQFVGIPEFADLGTKVSQEVSAAIAGSKTVDQALADGQKLAEDVAKKYK